MDDDRRRAEREVERRPGDPLARVALGHALARSGDRGGAARAWWRAAATGAPQDEVRAGLRALDLPSSPWPQVLGDATNAQATHALGPRRGDRALRSRVPGGSGRAAVVDDDGSIWVATAHSQVTRFTPALTDGYRNRRGGCDEVAALVSASKRVLASDGRCLAVVRREREASRRLDTADVQPLGMPRATPDGLLVFALADGRGFRTWRGEAWTTRIVEETARWIDGRAATELPFVAVQGERVAFAHSLGPLFVCALDGRVVARVESEGVWACPPVFAADGTVLALAVSPSSPHLAVVVTTGPDGRPCWRRELELRPPGERDHLPPSLALDPRGGVYALLRGAVVRLDASGEVEWRRAGEFCNQHLGHRDFVGGAAVDGEGVLFTTDGHAVVAFGPDGGELFRRKARLRAVLGIDALGRLLVFDHGQDLFAIGDRDGPAAGLEPGPVEQEDQPRNVAFVAW